MSIRIINSCQKKHKLDAEKIVRHILERIPAKFLIGLSEIHVFDSREEERGIEYRPRSNASKDSVIEISMENPALSGIPFFSILTLNGMFLFALEKHITTYLKPDSADSEILSYPPGRVQYNWMYLGIWNPLLFVFKIGNYLISKTALSHKIPRYFINHASQDSKKRKPP